MKKILEFGEVVILILKQLLLPIFLLFVVVLIILSMIDFCTMDSVIKNKGYDELKTELTYSEIICNKDGVNHINLNNKSSLNGYILRQNISIFYPYVLKSSDGFNYGILIFSKEYFLIKEIIDLYPCEIRQPIKF